MELEPCLNKSLALTINTLPVYEKGANEKLHLVSCRKPRMPILIIAEVQTPTCGFISLTAQRCSRHFVRWIAIKDLQNSNLAHKKLLRKKRSTTAATVTNRLCSRSGLVRVVQVQCSWCSSSLHPLQTQLFSLRASSLS